MIWAACIAFCHNTTMIVTSNPIVVRRLLVWAASGWCFCALLARFIWLSASILNYENMQIKTAPNTKHIYKLNSTAQRYHMGDECVVRQHTRRHRPTFSSAREAWVLGVFFFFFVQYSKRRLRRRPAQRLAGRTSMGGLRGKRERGLFFTPPDIDDRNLWDSEAHQRLWFEFVDDRDVHRVLRGVEKLNLKIYIQIYYKQKILY